MELHAIGMGETNFLLKEAALWSTQVDERWNGYYYMNNNAFKLSKRGEAINGVHILGEKN